MTQIIETTVDVAVDAAVETVSSKKAKRSNKKADVAAVEETVAAVEETVAAVEETVAAVEQQVEAATVQVEAVEQVQEIVMSLNSVRTLPSTTKSAAVRIMIAEAKVNNEEQATVVARVVTELGFKTALAKVYVRNNWDKVNAELRVVA